MGLFKPAWMSKDKGKCNAVRRLADQAVLVRLAEKEVDPDVCMVFAAKVSDPNLQDQFYTRVAGKDGNNHHDIRT